MKLKSAGFAAVLVAMNKSKLFSRAFLVTGCLIAAVQPFSGLAQEPFEVRKHFDWQIAICYHPMYMLVDEDRGTPVLGERLPPWGAATAEQYLERVKRNLASLEKDPKLTLNYEWAAAALEDIAVRFPDVMQRMQAAHRRGQLDFVGGEYSLAHTCVHGSEANWQQFEQGLAIFQRLFGQRITVHAHQEAHLYPQLPQILRHFGFDFLVMPSFPWAVTITEGPFPLLGHEHGTYLRKGDEFIRATAPDGTKLPAYFATNVRQTKPNNEYMKDLWSCPPLWIDFPDLEEYHNPNGQARPVLLGPAVAARFKAAPPRASGKIQTYYSYTESVWAEEHLRASKAAEEATVLAGNLLALSRLAGRPLDRQDKLGLLWRTLLKYQDHDATWIEVTDLRRKAIGQFQQVVTEDRKLMSEVAASLLQRDTNSIAVFNGVPRPRTALLEVGADEVPGGGAKLQKVGENFVGFVDLPAGGYRSFPLSKDPGREPKEIPLPERLDTDFYRLRFSKEGLIDTLAAADGRKLVTGGDYLGGEIRAVIGNRWANNRSATCKFYDGDVCGVLERTSTFGKVTTAAQPAPEASWIKEGKAGGALKLSGTSYVAAGGLGSFDQLTVAMWVKPTALDYEQQALLHSAGWDTSALHFILLKDGRVQAAVKGAEPVDLYSVATPGKQLGVWTHLALVYDAPGKRLKLFVNGRKDADLALTQAVPVKLDKFRLGAWDQQARFFNGALDDVRIYRGALDEGAIAGIAGGTNPPGAKLAAHWTMDQTDGTQLADTSGEKHPATIVQAELGAIIGRGIPLRERYLFFKHQPVIKAELEFDFDGDEIGDFHLEETKLNVYYPTPGGDIWHDVPFGFESAREGDQLLALNWVQCGGLTYVNRGTPKHWVQKGVIANTLAWGGKKWSNRIHYDWWMQRCSNYDLRLYGRQKIEYFLIPAGAFDGAAAKRAVEALTAPVFIAPGTGERSLCRLKDDSLAVTSLFEKEGQVWARGYQMPSAKKGRFRDWEIFNLPAEEMFRK